MPRQSMRTAALVTLTFAFGVGETPADAQVPNPCQPQMQCRQVCTPVQPVVQTCYQTVPVTTYQKEEVTVKKPVWDVEYVEQPVTEYRPVTETRTANVQTVNYANQTHYQTVTQNRGYWQSYKVPNRKVAPCQYDNRPGIAGWLSRTSYSFRSQFEPDCRTCRRYVPNTCTQVVPVTQRIPVYGTKEVSYQVTKMVPHQTTKRVAVRKLRYEDQTVTAMKPVTEYRTVPTGSTVAYAGGGATTAYYSGTGYATAYAPTYGYGYAAPMTAYWLPSTSGSATASNSDAYRRTAANPEPDPISNERRPQTATRPDDDFENAEPFRRDDGASLKQPAAPAVPGEWTQDELDVLALRRRREARARLIAQRSAAGQSSPSVVPTSRSSRPTIVRMSEQARRAALAKATGPKLNAPSVSLAARER